MKRIISFSKVYPSYTRRATQGIALVELAIVLPLIFVLIIGVVDLGRALINYLNFTQIVYEGARFASTYHDLEAPGSDPQDPDIIIPYYENLTNFERDVNWGPHHYDVQARIRGLVEVYNLDIATNSLNIKTKLIPRDLTLPPQNPQVDKNIIEIIVSADYSGLLPFVQLPMTITVNSGFIYSRFGAGGTCPPWVQDSLCPAP